MALVDCTSIKNDSNGNPRYVVHYSSLLSDAERATLSPIAGEGFISQRYAVALQRAHQIGGRKFSNKQFGGGIVFQAYSPDELGKLIASVVPK
jgi:hypothetical protein